MPAVPAASRLEATESPRRSCPRQLNAQQSKPVAANQTTAIPQHPSPRRLVEARGPGRNDAVKVPELPALTGIRFFAASLVFAGHVTKMPGMGWLEQHVLFHLATCGVAVFFVLSGFILTYNYAHSFRGGIHAGNYGRFIWDRLSKIYPLYLFTLLLCIPIQMIGQHRDWNWLALGLQVTLLQCILPIQQLRLTNYFNVPGWSISCEMFFYLLAPVLIWRCLAIKRLSVAVLLAGTVS